MHSRATTVRMTTAVIGTVLMLLSTGTLTGKGKPPTDQPVNAVIEGDPWNNSLGGIFSDVPFAPYSAVFNTNGEFYLNLQPGSSVGRWVDMYFADRQEGGSCAPCKSNLVQSPLRLGDGGGTGGYLRTNLVNSLDEEVSGGMANMPVGTPMKARFLVTFEVSDPDSVSRKNPSGMITFVLRYWPAYVHAAYVTVTRTGTDSWVIESSDSDGLPASGLWDDAARLIRPDGLNPIYEDLWRMPFKITVTR
jgi:hypothetical protein